MAITENDLDQIANLACLPSETSEKAQLAEEITDIMNFVEQLRKVDTRDVAPLFHPFDLHQRSREDAITEEDCRAQLAAIAPLFEDDMYLVPKVIDSGF